jgi:hypothetical protein
MDKYLAAAHEMAADMGIEDPSDDELSDLAEGAALIDGLMGL